MRAKRSVLTASTSVLRAVFGLGVFDGLEVRQVGQRPDAGPVTSKRSEWWLRHGHDLHIADTERLLRCRFRAVRSPARRGICPARRHSRNPCARRRGYGCGPDMDLVDGRRVIDEIESTHVVQTADMVLCARGSAEWRREADARTEHLAKRKSGPASMTIRTPHASTMAEVRRRLSRLSADVQTLQRQPMTGTPCEVPVPRKVSFMQAKIVKIGRLRTGTPEDLPAVHRLGRCKVRGCRQGNTPPSRRLPAKPRRPGKAPGTFRQKVPKGPARPAYPETPGNPALTRSPENPGTLQLRETQ